MVHPDLQKFLGFYAEFGVSQNLILIINISNIYAKKRKKKREM